MAAKKREYARAILERTLEEFAKDEGVQALAVVGYSTDDPMLQKPIVLSCTGDEDAQAALLDRLAPVCEPIEGVSS